MGKVKHREVTPWSQSSEAVTKLKSSVSAPVDDTLLRFRVHHRHFRTDPPTEQPFVRGKPPTPAGAALIGLLALVTYHTASLSQMH